MTPASTEMVEAIGRHRFYPGDCVELLDALPECSVGAVVTDPPYGLGTPPPAEDLLRAWLAGEGYRPGGGGFMGQTWDACVPGPSIWRSVLRVLKPGGFAVVFAGTRTVDLMGIALRLAGFEVRDTLHWCYWSGFPKSLDLSKAIDAAEGLERSPGTEGPYSSRRPRDVVESRGVYRDGVGDHASNLITKPACEESARWDGWGTGIKPAVEPALLVRRPLEGTYVENLRRWGVGGLNLDACRFAYGDSMWPGPQGDPREMYGPTWAGRGIQRGAQCDSQVPDKVPGSTAGDRCSDLGRFPANLLYVPKASRSERERWCEGLPYLAGHEAVGREEGSAGLTPRAGAGRSAARIRNPHPTVKPLRLMQWLCRLVTPPGGVVLDPFLGSGTTALAAHLEGFDAIGAEMTYPEIPRVRLTNCTRQQQLFAGGAA